MNMTRNVAYVQALIFQYQALKGVIHKKYEWVVMMLSEAADAQGLMLSHE